MTHKNRKKWRNSLFWSDGFSLLKDKGFSCRLDVLYAGLGISKFQFLIKKYKPFLVIKTLDPDPGQHWPKMLDPDPHSAKLEFFSQRFCRFSVGSGFLFRCGSGSGFSLRCGAGSELSFWCGSCFRFFYADPYPHQRMRICNTGLQTSMSPGWASTAPF